MSAVAAFFRRLVAPGRLPTTLLVLAVAACYFWTAGGSGNIKPTPEPMDYYNLLTEGFRHGHLYSAATPAPELLQLDDPYDPAANAPYRMHDMSYWKGHYYLYFGVAPVLLLFLPFRLLTGHFLPEAFAVALFCSIGFAFAAALVTEARQRWFPAVGPWLTALLLVALGLATPTIYLLQASQFYQVPISCAYALGMAALWCISRVPPQAGPRSIRWLVAAGCCVGVSLAARPNYLLATPILLVPLWWAVCGRDGWERDREKWIRPALAAFGPVLAVGLLLLTYNFLRFGEFFEFGMRFQLAGQNFTNFSPLGLKNLPPHLAIYAWNPAWWLPYFPFFQSNPERPFGVFHYLPLVWFGLVAFYPRRLAGEATVVPRLLVCVVLLGLAAANLAMDSMFFFQPELRYVSDFAPTFLLLGCLGALTAAELGRRVRWVVVPIGAAALFSLAVSLAIFAQSLPPGAAPDTLARFSNRVAAAVGHALGQRYGELKLDLELPVHPAESSQIVFATGHDADRRDWLKVHYLPDGRVQLGYFHAGIGETLGPPFAVGADRHLALTAATSAFLPPADHPYFRGWSEREVLEAQRRLRITANGADALSLVLAAYPSRPWDLLIGQAGALGYATDFPFTGKVLSAKTEPVERPWLAPRELTDLQGPVHLSLRLPMLGGGIEPLLTTGEVETGELLALTYGPDHTVRFTLYRFRMDPVVSDPVAYDPAQAADLVVWLGAWSDGAHPVAGLHAGDEHRLYVRWNGQVVIDATVPDLAGTGGNAAVGWNRVRFTLVGQEFTGQILAVKTDPIASLPARAP